MTTLEQMNEQQQKFVTKTQETLNVIESFKLHDKYYKWLLNQINDTDNTEEVRVDANVKRFNLIYQGTELLERNKAKAKDASVKWDKRLIARIGRLAYEDSNRAINGSANDADFKEAKSLLMTELNNADDLATVCYCYAILKTVNGIQVSKIIDSLLPKKVSETGHAGTYRPGHYGDILDNGGKYWHSEAEELMTYDECTARGLAHCFLCYPDGPLKNTYFGFSEPDKSKIKPVPKDPFVESVLKADVTVI